MKQLLIRCLFDKEERKGEIWDIEIRGRLMCLFLAIPVLWILFRSVIKKMEKEIKWGKKY